MPPTIVVEVLNTHHMIMTCFHFPAPGMGSLLRDSFGKEVGKRKWCETFAGPLVRRLSRSGGLSFIFSTEMLFFCAFFLCFSGAPEHKKKEKNTIHTAKKKNHTTKKSTKKHKSYHKKTQFISQKKAQTKHKSYQKKTHNNKKTQFIPQKNKKQSHFPFCFCFSFCFFSASFLFFLLLFFFFFSAFGQSSPAQFQPLSQPAPQASSPPPPSPQAQSPGLAQAQSSSPGLLYVLYTHSLLFCYRRCDGQHPKP